MLLGDRTEATEVYLGQDRIICRFTDTEYMYCENSLD